MPGTAPATGGNDGHAARTTPRRAALRQTRSRDTRRKLIRAALALWQERGFDEAYETTTAEEIARAAGVSKGTFYFHFAHKDDILLEMSWATAEVMAEEAEAGLEDGLATAELLDELMASLARRVARAPRAAVLRVTGHVVRLGNGTMATREPQGFGEVFRRVVAEGVQEGGLPGDLDVDEAAFVLQAVTMDALLGWAASDQSGADLGRTLRRRADVVLRGSVASHLA
jgi:AcrR family transcriptional regulator